MIPRPALINNELVNTYDIFEGMTDEEKQNFEIPEHLKHLPAIVDENLILYMDAIMNASEVLP